MEELFARQELVPTARRSFRARSPQSSSDMEVSILDAKKSMNIGIFLKQFKRPVESIVADIQRGMGGSYGAEKLVELSKLLPDKEEVKKLQEFSGDRGRVCEAERFLLLLTELPNYEQRLECLILKMEFSPQMEALRAGVRTLTEAASELLNCEELHTVIRLVLKAGNYMNAGGYAGNAFGFRMASLVKLADTRANKPGINLMHFVVMEAEKNDKKLLDFPSKLQNVAAASRLFKQDIENDTERLKHKLQMVKGNLSKVPEIREQMEEFVEEAEGQLEQLQEALGRLETVSKHLAEFLCEDQLHLEESCSIFQNFSEKFLAAREENRQRQSKEMRRHQREEEAAKRLSIASCSHRERGLTNPDADLESLLLGNRRSFRQRPVSERLPRSQSLRLVSNPAQAPNTALPPSLVLRAQAPVAAKTQASTQAPVISPSPAPNPSVVPPSPSTSPTLSPEEVLRLRQVSERLLGPRITRRLGSGPRPQRSSAVTCSPPSTAAPDPDSTPVPSSGHPHDHLPLAGAQTQAVAPLPPTLPAAAASVASRSSSPPLARPSRPSTGRSLSVDILEPTRTRVHLSRGFSVDRPTLPTALRRPSSTSISSILRRHSSSSTPSRRRPSTLFQRQPSTSSPTRRRRSSASRSLRGVKPPAADRPEHAAETKATGSGFWSISNLFGKKPPKAVDGAGGAAAESEAKEPAVAPSRGAGFISSLFKGFSGHKGPKH
ncbi:FH2 domain-containing protein 1-like isoform X1 [Hypanus sabinus]|uniref:FH2 domain-containing protein 1-like isoform X1 n=2 Tax=Hypanus sabinus TaxID=79690 RepID=UPI0028C4AAF8|nr:FH2 domain-containing protein 1-like isoform X1 [Hypanus sabinus]